MANDGKIYIIVTDQLPNGGGQLVPDQQKEKEKDKGSSLAMWAEHQFYNLVKQQVMGNINFTVNNIGNFTGDYQAQRNAQLNLSILNEAMGLGMAVYAGSRFGAPGVAVALGVYAANKTISTMQQYALINLQQKQSNYSIEQLRNRAGLNSYKDGSRGTEN